MTVSAIILLLVISHTAYSQADCLCGVSHSSRLDICQSKKFQVRITGGEEAEINEFPWAALLEIKVDGANKPFRCGGTLVNDKYVLTAAHCVSSSSYQEITVILGEHDTTSRLESTSLRIKAKPYRFNKHWSYKQDVQTGVFYDFSLIELAERVDFTGHPHIRPVCLPDSQEVDYDQNEVATVSGWGLENVDYQTGKGLVKGVGNGLAKKLKKLDVRLMSQRQCRDIFYNVEPKIKLKESNLCAISQSGDSCKGDSGGGLVRARCAERFYELVGVVSYGIGCNSTHNGVKIPGVYARVSSVVKWITAIASDGVFCEKPSSRLPTISRPTPTRPPTPTRGPTPTRLPAQPSGWGEWSSFSKCDEPCGIGKKSRDRFCRDSGCRRTQQSQDRICRIKFC
eukprot:GFUD01028022.1.p1 GENE.GFUD01028022.1~~GFUD01028022.1.p1  ORF type:complete len:397 (+),score=85.51 GFUD01028022.1:124-1314(+)